MTTLAGAALELRVSKRLLWIGTAAYPLHNITRVRTSLLQPRRRDALVRWLKYTAGTVSVAFLATLPALPLLLAPGDPSGGGYLLFVWLLAFTAGGYFFVEAMQVWTARSQYVLAIETSSSSAAVVTSRNPQYLDQLVGQISYAIEHPETEFQVTVERLTVSPANYHFGDNVNMYGGSGNVGIAA
ncbi:DUF6232 family protein [Streptomyces sp. NPDC047024]|uniref:DUF6232 family protein n=1 Tax=Streptomyces sp. NPDC047024 TaxID=3155476 RepID=UPI0033FF4A31